jgi:hypothetical protein
VTEGRKTQGGDAKANSEDGLQNDNACDDDDDDVVVLTPAVGKSRK